MWKMRPCINKSEQTLQRFTNFKTSKKNILPRSLQNDEQNTKTMHKRKETKEREPLKTKEEKTECANAL